jgi:hypothetical protein
MKLTSLTAVLCVLCAAAGFAGCGTVVLAGAALADDIDYAKVNAINNAARAQGVQVHWINLPQKLKTSSASKPAGAG